MRRRDLLTAASAFALLSSTASAAWLRGGSTVSAAAAPVTFRLVNNTGGTLANQPINLARTTKQGTLNLASQHLQFAIGGTVLSSTMGFSGVWSDGSACVSLVALTVPSLPVGSTTITMTVQSGAASTALPGSLTVSNVKTAILAYLNGAARVDGLGNRPAGNDIVVSCAGMRTFDNTVQGSGNWKAKLSDALAASACTVTYQGATYIEFRALGNYIKDVVGGASHAFVQADWYIGAHLDGSGNVTAVRAGPRLFQGVPTIGVTQTEYWYDLTLQDGSGNVLIDLSNPKTFTDADISAVSGHNISIHIPAHGFGIADAVTLASTGTLPSPLTPWPGGPYITNLGSFPQTVANDGGPLMVWVLDADHIALVDQAVLAQSPAPTGAYDLTVGGGGTHIVSRKCYHFRGSRVNVLDARMNWYWSDRSPVAGTNQNRVDVIQEPAELIKNGVIPPYDLTLGASMPTPTSPALGHLMDGIYSGVDRYAPGACGGRTICQIDNTGEHGCLGIHPHWSAFWVQTKDPGWLDTMRVYAGLYDHFPEMWRDPTLATIPSLTPSPTFSGMNALPTLWTAKLTLTAPSDASVFGDHIIRRGWVTVRTGNDASHLGEFGALPYLLEGDRGIKDGMLHHWHGPMVFYLATIDSPNFWQQTDTRDKQISGGPIYHAVINGNANYRSNGWMARSLAHLLMTTPPSEIEYPYLKDRSAVSAQYANDRFAAMGATYRTQGAYQMIASAETNGRSEDSEFFHAFCWHGFHLMAKIDPTAGWPAVRDQLSNRYTPVGGSGNPLQISMFGGDVIDDAFNSNSFTDLLNGWGAAATDKYSANANGANWGSITPGTPPVFNGLGQVSMTFQGDGATVLVDGMASLVNSSAMNAIEPLHANSRFRFPGGQSGSADAGTAVLPTGITPNTKYRFISSTINLTTRTAQISTDGATPVTWTPGNGVRPQCVWQYGGIGPYFVNALDYTHNARAIYATAIADGLSGFANGWADMLAYVEFIPPSLNASAAQNCDPRWVWAASR